MSKFKIGTMVKTFCNEEHETQGYVVDNFTTTNDDDGAEEKIVVVGSMGEDNLFVEEDNVKSSPVDDGKMTAFLLASIDQNLKVLNEKINSFIEGVKGHAHHHNHEQDEDEGENFNN